MTKMSVIRGIIILHLVSVCFAAETTKAVSMKTGNQLAVLRFEGWSISEPLTEFLTEELRETIRELEIFQVQDRGLTNEISIFYPRKKDYWACWSKDCAIDLGKRLKVNYVIAGNIQKKDLNEFLISGRLFSVDMETMINEFSMNSSGITDSLLLEMKNYFGLGGLKNCAKATKIPLIAIGGIKVNDVNNILKLKIHGVAMISSLLKGNIKDNCSQVSKIIKSYEKI